MNPAIEEEPTSSKKRQLKLKDASDLQLPQPSRAKFSKVVEFYWETDTNELVKKSNMFKGMEFCIINVDESVANKPYLESRIVEHGGRRV